MIKSPVKMYLAFQIHLQFLMQGKLRVPLSMNLKISRRNWMYRDPSTIIKFCVSYLNSLNLEFRGLKLSSSWLNLKIGGNQSSVGHKSKVEISIRWPLTATMLAGKMMSRSGW